MFGFYQRAFEGFGLEDGNTYYFFGLLGQRQAVYVGNVFSCLVFYCQFHLFSQFVQVHMECFKNAYSSIFPFPDQAKEQMFCANEIVSQPECFFPAE